MNPFAEIPVVVPVDMSAESLEAVDVALGIVDDPSSIHVVRVLPDLKNSSPDMLDHAIDHAKRRNAALNELATALAEGERHNVQTRIEFGDPGRCIAELAEAIAARLIVMPSHGRRGLQRLLIGSVAERVTRLAHCPVLILRR